MALKTYRHQIYCIIICSLIFAIVFLGPSYSVGLLFEDVKYSEIINHSADIEVENIDDYLRMNQIQVLGTHNSYHLMPNPKLHKKMRFFSKEVDAWQYSHLSLNEQLEIQKIRQVELDVFPDPKGGLFADRIGNLLIGEERYVAIPQLLEPGFKVLHVPFVDFETTCYTFVEGLETIRDWSLENNNHLPVMILVEVKSGLPLEYVSWPLRALIRAGKYFLKLIGKPVEMPLLPNEDDLIELEKEILSVFEKSHIITPDEIRGDSQTLEEAILKNGWPFLKDSRGRVFFALDNEDEVRDFYLKNNPSLENRLMFTSSHPGEPSAAFIKINDPRGDNESLIRSYVGLGYIVRTRADADLFEAKERDLSRQEAAFNSGAQFISTDFPTPGMNGYSVKLPGAEDFPARCNPVNSLISCNEKILYNFE